MTPLDADRLKALGLVAPPADQIGGRDRDFVVTGFSPLRQEEKSRGDGGQQAERHAEEVDPEKGRERHADDTSNLGN